jgi:hypothetical protein
LPLFQLDFQRVDQSAQDQGLCCDLLFAAGKRALAVAAEIGGVALAIDSKDERAARWYERFGAVRLLDDRLNLVIPLSVIAEAIITAGK